VGNASAEFIITALNGISFAFCDILIVDRIVWEYDLEAATGTTQNLTVKEILYRNNVPYDNTADFRAEQYFDELHIWKTNETLNYDIVQTII